MRLPLLALGLALAPSPATADRGPAACPDGMVEIPAGTFGMGSARDEDPHDEHPQHAVKLERFCLDRTEVTVAMYARCVAAGRCTRAAATVYWPDIGDADRAFWSPFCHGDRLDRQRYPVNCIDWEQARAYCDYAGKRLPTEAEWEYAARGRDGRIYPWGNEPPTARHENACGTECAGPLGRAWRPTYRADDGFVNAAPVGSFPAGASPFGVLDMAGNVWEWVADWYGPYPHGGNAMSGERRVYRGGGWSGDGPRDHTRALRRGKASPSFRSTSGGVRCAKG